MPREYFYEPDARAKGFDALHALMSKYDYDLSQAESKAEHVLIEHTLVDIIHQDPNFFDPYMELYHFYNLFKGFEEQAAAVLEEAYTLALKMITDKKGNWPDVIEWHWQENRNVIRALIGGAITRWKENKPALARVTLRNILKTNPSDNPGVRFLILAINEKMSYQAYQKRFEKDNTLAHVTYDWFNENSKKYPEDFEWWEKVMAEMEL